MCILAIFMSSSEKYHFRFSAYFLMGLFGKDHISIQVSAKVSLQRKYWIMLVPVLGVKVSWVCVTSSVTKRTKTITLEVVTLCPRHLSSLGICSFIVCTCFWADQFMSLLKEGLRVSVNQTLLWNSGTFAILHQNSMC